MPYMGKDDQLETILLAVAEEGTTERVRRICTRLIQYYGGWFALDPLPNGNYELTVKKADAARVMGHIAKA